MTKQQLENYRTMLAGAIATTAYAPDLADGKRTFIRERMEGVLAGLRMAQRFLDMCVKERK